MNVLLRTVSRLFAVVVILMAMAVTSNVANATTVFIGDWASRGDTAMIDLGGADSGGGGQATYIFSGTDGGSNSSGFVNSTGGTLSIQLTDVNFWSDNTTGTLTPFVAIYTGDTSATDIGDESKYSVISQGGDIAVNATGDTTGNFGETVNLLVGQRLVAGFRQTTPIVPFNTGGIADLSFIDINGNAIPNPLPDNPGPNTHVLSRTYAFNVKMEVNPIPEPSSLLLLGVASLGLIGVRRRRK